MSHSRILVVDDDAVTRDVVRGVLERAGHDVREAADGRAGLRDLYAAAPDLVILDVEMPELDGWAMLERIRDLSDVPVLMLTARESRARARARAARQAPTTTSSSPSGTRSSSRACTRCCAAPAPRAHEQQTYADARLQVDFAQRAVRYGEREVQLTPLEFKLLSTFVRNPNQVLSRAQLLELVWGDAVRSLARAGEAVCGLSAPQARPRGARLDADRDRARLRLPLPAVIVRGRSSS